MNLHVGGVKRYSDQAERNLMVRITESFAVEDFLYAINILGNVCRYFPVRVDGGMWYQLLTSYRA